MAYRTFDSLKKTLLSRRPPGEGKYDNDARQMDRKGKDRAAHAVTRCGFYQGRCVSGADRVYGVAIAISPRE